MFHSVKYFIVPMSLSLSLIAGAALAQAPKVVEPTQQELSAPSKGRSITKDILSKDVFTDKAKEKVGVIEDLIMTKDLFSGEAAEKMGSTAMPADNTVSHVVISTGGFLGIAKHDVIVPVGQLKMIDARIVLPGATQETVKAMPEFTYAK